MDHVQPWNGVVVDVSSELTVAEALESLREQLLDAVDRAQGADLMLMCQGVEVELQVTATTVRKGDAKVGLWTVVTVGAGVDSSTANTHKIKLILQPQFKDGRRKLAMSDND